MSDQGYLYVLANSAMPGLVKIGKTTRTPLERAEELSSATGLPTPFIVVYEQFFNDCSIVENFVHATLEVNGFRVSNNREFFNAPVNIVIRAINAAPGTMDDHRSRADIDISENGMKTPAWIEVEKQAITFHYGLGDVLQDYAEALRFYKLAIKLGSLSASGVVGKMYESGEGTQIDTDEALKHYKEGANNGDPYCYWRLAFIYFHNGNVGNMVKCSEMFCRIFKETSNVQYLIADLGLEGAAEIDKQIVGSRIGNDFPPAIKAMLSVVKESILTVLSRSIENRVSEGDTTSAYYMNQISQYARSL